MKKVLMGFGVIALIAIGCTKSSSPNYTDNVVGNWTQTSAITWFEPKTGPIQKDTTYFDSTSYTNLLSYDSIYIRDRYLTTGLLPDSSSGIYWVTGNKITSIIARDTTISTILSLTNHKLTIYNKTLNYDTLGSTVEQWTFLVR